MNKIIKTLILSLTIAFTFMTCYTVIDNEKTDEIVVVEAVSNEAQVIKCEQTNLITTSITEETVEEQKVSEEDIELIALVTMAEAEGECEEGKRLVIDTILNRVDSEHFPNTIYEVIYQPSQFTSMWNGRADRCEVHEDICQLVRYELESRTNYDVMFFTAGNYSDYGVPIFQVGNHYFSSYE